MTPARPRRPKLDVPGDGSQGDLMAEIFDALTFGDWYFEQLVREWRRPSRWRQACRPLVYYLTLGTVLL